MTYSISTIHNLCGSFHEMFIKCPCAVCINKNPPVRTTGDGEVTDSGLTFVTCPHGHRSAMILEERKYMLLMISAVQTMADGHLREAVSSLAAALERCFEFYFKAMLYKSGLPKDKIATVWKPLASQSERQFGAFCAAFAVETHTPFHLPPNVPEFRNKVIHKGHLTNSKEVTEFGRKIYNLIKKISDDMNVVGKDAIKLVEQESLDLQKSQIPSDLEYATVTIFSVRIIDEDAGIAERIDTFDELCHSILKSEDHKWGDM